MDQSLKFTLEAIQQKNNAETKSNYFEPEVHQLKKKVPMRCPHCNKTVHISKIEICTKAGIMGATGDLSAGQVGVFANCPSCGVRIPTDEKGLKSVSGLSGKLVMTAVLTAAILFSVFLVGYIRAEKVLPEKYLAEGELEIEKGNYLVANAKLEKAANWKSGDAYYLLGKLSNTITEGGYISLEDTTIPEIPSLAYSLAEMYHSELQHFDEVMAQLEEYIEEGSDDSEIIEGIVSEISLNTRKEAKYQYSLMCRAGVGTSQDSNLANSYLKDSAEAGYVKAVCEYAKRLAVQGDLSEALDLLSSYPNKYNLDVQATKGWIYLLNGNPNEGIKLIVDAANEGNTCAYIYLGDIFLNGTIGEPDTKTAEMYYNAACELSSTYNSDAELGVAACLLERNLKAGNSDELEQALSIAQKCLLHGNANAWYILSYFKANGVLGVDRDEENALEFALIAANNNYPKAEILAAELCSRLGKDSTSMENLLVHAYHQGAMKSANQYAEWILGKEAFGDDFIPLSAEIEYPE